jgi:hypothetical protein
VPLPPSFLFQKAVELGLSIPHPGGELGGLKFAFVPPVIQRSDIQATTGCFGQGRGLGPPERVLSLADAGVELLQAERLLDPGVPKDRVTAATIRSVDHQLLLNWIRVHLGKTEQLVPQIKVRFLSSNSPFLPTGVDDRPLAYDRSEPTGGRIDAGGFLPDGVFSFTHIGRQMTLLFFLEVDMGTETLASRRRDTQDVRQKIITYQGYFRSRRYKRYEQILAARLRGFRVLFVTHSPNRLAGLCRLVQSLPPSDFVWLTDRARMFSQGIEAAIWARGGRIEAPLESILGSEMPKAGSLSLPGSLNETASALRMGNSLQSQASVSGEGRVDPSENPGPA